MKQKISSTQKALNLWAVILIIWSVYRANFQLPEWLDEFIVKPLVFILPVYYYIVKIEKKDFLADIYFKVKSLSTDISMGLSVGGIFFLTAVLATYIKYKSFGIFSGTISLKFIAFSFFIAIATSISEEILSRGFVLKRLYQESKNIITASFFASVLFFFLHIPMLFTNAKITGNVLILFLITDLIFSLAISFVFLIRKSLVLPILIHAFYNLSLMLFI